MRTEHGDSKYLLVNKKSIKARQRKLFKQLAKEGSYKLVERRGDLFLFGRDVRGKDPTAAFGALGVRLPKAKK